MGVLQSRVDQPAGAGLVGTPKAHGYVYTLRAVYSKRFWGYVKQGEVSECVFPGMKYATLARHDILRRE